MGNPPASRDPPTRTTKHPLYTALILESFFLTLSDVLCVRCQYIGIHSRNVFLNRSGLILQKKIRKFAENRQAHKQTNRQTENSNTEATLIPCGSSGGAGQLNSSSKHF